MSPLDPRHATMTTPTIPVWKVYDLNQGTPFTVLCPEDEERDGIKTPTPQPYKTPPTPMAPRKKRKMFTVLPDSESEVDDFELESDSSASTVPYDSDEIPDDIWYIAIAINHSQIP